MAKKMRDVTARVFPSISPNVRKCKDCGEPFEAKSRPDGGLTMSCEDCSPVERFSSVTSVQEIKTLPMMTCTQCKKPFEPYQRGCTKPSICPECMEARVTAGNHRSFKIPDGHVLVDFSQDEALLQDLTQAAGKQRRTLGNHILFLLEHSDDRR